MNKEQQINIVNHAIENCVSGYKDARKKLADWFISQVGITEQPVNKIIFNDWFYKKPVNGKSYAWCATFCCYGHAFNGFKYPSMGWTNGFCSVPDYHKRSIIGKKITTEPKPMDDVIFDWENDGADDHIGKFVAWVDDSKQEFYTIEGNTAFDPANDNNLKLQSRGGAVAFKKRKIGTVSAFVSVEHLLH